MESITEEILGKNLKKSNSHSMNTFVQIDGVFSGDNFVGNVFLSAFSFFCHFEIIFKYRTISIYTFKIE